MKNKIKYLLVCLGLIVFVVGCSNTNTTPATNKPDDVRQEIWDMGLKYYSIIDEKMSNQELLSNEDHEIIGKIVENNLNDNLSEKEKDICVGTLTMAKLNYEFMVAKLNKDDLSMQSLKVRYDEAKEKLKPIYLTKG